MGYTKDHIGVKTVSAASPRKFTFSQGALMKIYFFPIIGGGMAKLGAEQKGAWIEL